MEQTRPSTAWRAGFSLILLWGMAVGMIAQLAISALAPFIIDDLGISRTEIGLLSMAYFAAGAGGSLIAGPQVDRRGGRWMLLLLFVVGGLSLLGLGLSATIAALLATMALAGIATAISNPVTNHLVGVHLARGAQGMTIGIKQAGVGVATLMAGSIYPWLAHSVGWREALLMSAGLCFAGIAGTVAVLPKPAARPRDVPVPRDTEQAWRSQPALIWWLASYAFLMGTAGSIMIVFLVLYGVEAVDLTPGVAGSSLALMGAAGICARVFWGRVAERLLSPIPVLGLLALLAAISQLLIWSAAAAGAWALWSGVVIYGASAMGWNSVVMVTIVREIGVERSGTASGIVQAAFYGGYIFSPTLFGWVADKAGGYEIGWAAVTTLSLVAACQTLVWRRATGRAGAQPPASEPAR